MKKFLFAAAIACLALFTSCEKEGGENTGDTSGNLYGVWLLDTVAEAPGAGEEASETDYSGVHFYLALGEFPFPHAIAKKGSFTDFDLDDVDVDAVGFTYNEDQKKISFKKKIWLSDGFLKYNMILDGTLDVLELTDKKFVIRKSDSFAGVTTYHFSRYK